MCDRPPKTSAYELHPNAVYLSDRYRQLEGFTSLAEGDTKVLTTADVQRQKTALPVTPFADAIITLGIMFGLLIGSSVFLGFAANQASVITRHLTQVNVQQVKAR